VDLLIQIAIDVHPDLIANSFCGAANVTQNAIEYHLQHREINLHLNKKAHQLHFELH
jgi:hypothetical protein